LFSTGLRIFGLTAPCFVLDGVLSIDESFQLRGSTSSSCVGWQEMANKPGLVGMRLADRPNSTGFYAHGIRAGEDPTPSKNLVDETLGDEIRRSVPSIDSVILYGSWSKAKELAR